MLLNSSYASSRKLIILCADVQFSLSGQMVSRDSLIWATADIAKNSSKRNKLEI